MTNRGSELGSAKPGMIEASTDGPYVVTGVATLVNSRGERLPAEPKMTLCRCGGSTNKPFCDGTHGYNSLYDNKLQARAPGPPENWAPRCATSYDNHGTCAPAARC